eukprot:1389766-Amorphochlora_amoeboformis.AAC.1
MRLPDFKPCLWTRGTRSAGDRLAKGARRIAGAARRPARVDARLTPGRPLARRVVSAMVMHWNRIFVDLWLGIRAVGFGSGSCQASEGFLGDMVSRARGKRDTQSRASRGLPDKN